MPSLPEVMGIVAGLVASAIGGIVLYLYLFCNIRWRDWHFLINGLRLKGAVSKFIKGNMNAALLWDNLQMRFGPQHPCMLFENRTWTIGDTEALANQIAHWGLSCSLECAHVVALCMTNRPQFVCTWLGMAKIGVRTALINYNLRGKQLLHSLQISGAKILIFGPEVSEAIAEIQEGLTSLGIRIFCYCGPAPKFAASLDNALQGMSTQPVAVRFRAKERGVHPRDPLLYIYTSGTTGLPKAAIMTHHRFFTIGSTHRCLPSCLTHRDRLFCALPLYHSSGGVINVGMMMTVSYWNLTGCLLILKDRFSASTFFRDIRDTRATVFQYIGEVCRYTLAQPLHPDDAKHCVRLAIGNGLRPDIWPVFQKRFAVPRIAEFYGSTEGPGGMLNTCNKEGAIGFMSPLVAAISPMKLCRFDIEQGELLRTPEGLCVVCKPGEVGELLTRIEPIAHGVSNFAGYSSTEASQKKIVSGVMKQGDMYFRTGDLMRIDSEGFCYFIDRVGDTFRWKSENVSTLEVAEIVSTFPGCEQVTVYGVEVKGQEGRCGMAAIALQDGKQISWEGLAKHVIKSLPPYSRPVFIRTMKELDTTGTYKFRKVDLQAAGFDCGKIDDPLYFLSTDSSGSKYIPLDCSLYKQIVDGRVRF